jgi:lysophospholipase L1-like esterase
MKKILSTMMTLILALTLLASAAGSAAVTPRYTGEADALYALGLFKGTNTGYELERIPNRTEALVLLVRLLGKDTEAKACKDAVPFTDVDAWAVPYVAWAYGSGLTKGTTDTEFGARSEASAQMFITFVLRALGYDDAAGDFNYASAIQKAEEIGLAAQGAYPAGAGFYRDDCVHLSYTALTATLKAGTSTLAEKLAADGAISSYTARRLGLIPAYAGAVKSVTVACVGDSLTFGMGTANQTTESYPGVLATLTGPFTFITERYGHSGATVDYESKGAFAPSYASTQEYADSLNTKAEVIVIMLGTNDAVWSSGQPDFTEDYAQMLDTYLNLPHKPKVIAMLPPHLLGLKGYDDKLEKVVEMEKAVIQEKGLDLIDAYTFSADMAKYSKDGVHFTPEGYKLLAEFVYEALGDILSE